MRPHPALALAVLLALSLLAASRADAEARVYDIDPIHTRIAFLIDHAGFSRAIGTFSGITGRIDFDPEAPQRSRVEASVPIGSLDLGDPDWNARMLERRFFQVDRHPRAEFISTRIEPLEEGRLRVRGELRLRGVVREIEFVATINADRTNPVTFKRTLGASAELEIERARFRLGAFPTVIGSHARVLIELEALRQNRPSDSDQEPRS